MTNRPRTASHDENHFIPRDFLRDRCGGFATSPKEIRGRTMAYTANFRGRRILLIDTSPYGGVFPDWHIEISNGRAAWIEIKTEEAFKAKNHSLKPGELWTQANSGLEFCIICTDEDFANLLADMVHDD